MRFLTVTLFSIIWTSLTLAAPAYSQSPPSAYEFMKPSENYGLTISPTGRYMAFLQTNNMKYCLSSSGQMQTQAKAKCKEKKRVYRTTFKISVYDYEEKKNA